MALGKVNFPDAHPALWVSRNNWREQKEKAHSDPFVLGKRKWISLRLREMAIFFDNFYQPQALFPPASFCIPLSSTPRNFPRWVSVVESKRGLKTEEEGVRCLKLRHRKQRGGSQRNRREISRSWKFKEGPHKCSPFSGEPNTPFWKSRALLQPQENGAEKTGSRGQREERNLYSVFLIF